MTDTACFICEKPFKPEDFSTFYTVGDDPEEYLAHDDCLDELIYLWKSNPLIKIWVTGHKFWSDND